LQRFMNDLVLPANAEWERDDAAGCCPR
jgi:hypothetical protein